MRALSFVLVVLICQTCSLAGQVEKKAREGKETPDLSRPLHNGHHSDDGRCEGGTDLTESSSEDVVDSALINGQPVRREHEPKRHVKTSQVSQEETIPPHKNVGLDITDVDLRVVTISESFVDGMLVKKTFTPNDGYRLTEVYDMNLAIWTSSDSKEYAKSVVVHYTKDGSHLLSIGINNGHSTKPKCFEKNGSTWSEISDYAFFNKHDLMVEEYPDLAAKGLVPSGRSPIPSKQVPPREPKGDVNTPLKPGGDISNVVQTDLNHRGEPIPVTSPKFTKQIVLDIASPDSSYIHTLIRLPYEMAIKVYSAKDGYRISSIVDRDTILWTSSNDNSCEHVAVIRSRVDNAYTVDTVGLIAIYTRNKEGTKMPLYYKKVSSKWNTIEEAVFYRRFHFEAIKGSVIDAVTLDVKGKNDPAQFYITRSSDFPFVAYVPNVGYRIKAVKEGSTNIWEAESEDEGCLYTSLYPKTTPTLAYLVIHTSEDLKELCYSKASGSWKSVNKDIYLTDLKKAGFNGSTFTNEITLDLSRPNEDLFYIRGSKMYDYAVNMYVMPTCFRLNRIVDGDKEVWRALGGERSTYMNLIFNDKKPFTFFILIDDPKGNRKVLYFFKMDDGVWKNVKKEDYHAFIPARLNGMNLPKMDGQKITMSSFRNRQGLRLTSYASTVNKSKGDIVMVHGLRSHFMSEFGTANVEWSYKHFGYLSSSLYIDGLFVQDKKLRDDNVTRHRHLFERTINFEGKDASLVQPGYEYEGSIIEFLNKMGYNVYGMDLQSHGLSEAQTEKKCHVGDFKDYLYDLLQFVSIIKRGKFNDASQVWNEQTVFAKHSTDRRTVLFGHSMGGNIIMQAIQEFYKEVKNPQTKLVDGLIVTSGMFNINFYLDTCEKKIARRCLPWCIGSCFARCCDRFKVERLEEENPYETPLNYGEAFDLFLRHRDPFFHTNRLTLRAIKAMFDACDDVKKDDRMVNYPKNLPTLFLHSKDDNICDAKGPRDMMEKLNKEKATDVKFIELDSSFHYLTIPQAMVALQSYFKEWLDKHTSV